MPINLTKLAKETGTTKGASPYGRSGSILVLNPIDKRVKAATDMTSPELREPETIRGWPSAVIAPPDPGEPTILAAGASSSHNQLLITGTGFQMTGVVYLRLDKGDEDTWVEYPISAVNAPGTQLVADADTGPGVSYQLTVTNAIGESPVFVFTA